MKQLALLILLAAGCRAPDVAYAPVDDSLADAPRWCPEERPAYLAISDALDPDCAEAVLAAVDAWRAQGVTYLHPVSVPDVQLTPGRPWPRFIQVTKDLPAEPGATGEAAYHRITYGCIDAAEIHLAACRKQTAMHELGHALGLPHDGAPDNLMFPAVDVRRDGPYGLTAEQLEHVR